MSNSSQTKRYTPRVRQIIRAMQSGQVLRKTMEIAYRNYLTGAERWAAVYYLGKQSISQQAFDAIRNTNIDLVSIGKGDTSSSRNQTEYLVAQNTYVIELTERGSKIKWNSKGEEMSEDWTPRPLPQPLGPFFYLAPSANTIVRCQSPLRPLMIFGEPALQIPGMEDAQWEDRKRGKTWAGGTSIKRKVKGRMRSFRIDYQVVDATMPLRCIEFEEYEKEVKV